ncbi:MAG: hypothetical protein AB7O91_07990 [Sphingomonas sp.]
MVLDRRFIRAGYQRRVIKRDNRGVEERRRLNREGEARCWQARQRREALERTRADGLERLLAEHQRQQQLEAGH